MDKTYKSGNDTQFSVRIKIKGHQGLVYSFSYLNMLGGCNDGEYIKLETNDKTVFHCRRIINPDEIFSGGYFYGDSINITYVTSRNITAVFEITLTAFVNSPCSSDDLFLCDVGICVWKGLTCDSRNNCGDGSDENSDRSLALCQLQSSTESSDFIPLFISLPLILLGMTLVLYCCIKRQWDETQFETGNVFYVSPENDVRTVGNQNSDQTQAVTASNRISAALFDDKTCNMKTIISPENKYETLYLDEVLDLNITLIPRKMFLNVSYILKSVNNKSLTKPESENISFSLDREGKSDGIIISITYLHFRAGCNGDEFIKISSIDKSVTLCEEARDNYLLNAQYFYRSPVEILYFTKRNISITFEIIATAFTRSPCSGEDMFKCKNNLCIQKIFLCDQRDNCGDTSDEQSVPNEAKCAKYSPAQMEHFIPLFITLPLVLLGTTLVLYCCFKRHPRESQYKARDILYLYRENHPQADETPISDIEESAVMSQQALTDLTSDEMYPMKTIIVPSVESAAPEGMRDDVKINNYDEKI
ncbi:uncharacterized protein NPIL_197701 [Nephila pilipes]|uniref:CUB domain-containing protein n=1 Tax=Nephila pilipes TaxID=299642 RepID=A0A8X6P719_NEPPI|nr:uncharacterized protein NPIL_197701 [Nephila pilipes]